ncbi:MAG: hypothetical protein ABIQ05_08585 [Candidatus Limnocylindria bacterium]
MTGTDPSQLPEDGPTELVEGRDGELVERLSGGTATLLLVWLIGVGVGTALLGAWLLAAVVLEVRLDVEHLFGAPGLYTALYGSTGPTVLWLTGRAQGHRLGWFVWTAAKIGLVMAAILVGGAVMVTAVMGSNPGSNFVVVATALVGLTLAASFVWALATWAADRYIARARLEGDQTS